LVATDRKALLAPAMNPHMWQHKATQRNLARLVEDGVALVGPNAGEMAEAGEAGVGRMAEPLEIAAAALSLIGHGEGALKGKRVIVTSGPTHEPSDPVRYIANRSSGKQGHAIAAAAAEAGAHVTLVSGPVNVPDPPGVAVVKVTTAQDMLAAVTKALPADVAVFAAAVADWRIAKPQANKIKKGAGGSPKLALTENPDILATVAHETRKRPRLVIGFAAETEHIIEHAKAKLARKGCDWILANDVSAAGGAMGGDRNTVHLVTAQGGESWPPQSKEEVARALVARIAKTLAGAKRGARSKFTSCGCPTPPACRCRPIRARTRPGSTSSPRCRRARPLSSRRAGAPQSQPGSRSRYLQESRGRSARARGWRCTMASRCSILRA